MTRTLSLRELRQNPTQAIDALEAGETIVVTRRNRPIADLVPHAARNGASPAEFAALIERSPVDGGWADELAQHRAEESRNVWGDA